MAEKPGNLGFTPPRVDAWAPPNVEYVIVQRPLQRLMAFTGHSIDDIVNSPIAKNRILGYFKLQRQIQWRGEVVELEGQWNPLGQ